MTRERKPSRVLDDEAALWAARMDSRSLTDEENAALQGWLGSDPRAAGAFARTQAVLAHFDRARALAPGFDVRDFAGGPPAFWSRRAAIAAGLGAAAAAGGFALLLRPTTLTTRHGEIRTVPLEDRSTVTLNTASSVQVSYGSRRRAVDLIEGEVMFDVLSDSARPFTVTAGLADVRVLGTRFAIRRTEAAVRVVVREGSVQVRSARTAATHILQANMAAIMTPGGHVDVRRLTDAQLWRALAWRDGLLSFRSTSLRAAAAEFARYSDIRIVIDDPRLADQRIDGLFAFNDPVGFARAVATSLNAVVSSSGNSIRLSYP